MVAVDSILVSQQLMMEGSCHSTGGLQKPIGFAIMTLLFLPVTLKFEASICPALYLGSESAILHVDTCLGDGTRLNSNSQ